jgi:hypothetical protein
MVSPRPTRHPSIYTAGTGSAVAQSVSWPSGRCTGGRRRRRAGAPPHASARRCLTIFVAVHASRRPVQVPVGSRRPTRTTGLRSRDPASPGPRRHRGRHEAADLLRRRHRTQTDAALPGRTHRHQLRRQGARRHRHALNRRGRLRVPYRLQPYRMRQRERLRRPVLPSAAHKVHSETAARQYRSVMLERWPAAGRAGRPRPGRRARFDVPLDGVTVLAGGQPKRGARADSARRRR